MFLSFSKNINNRDACGVRMKLFNLSIRIIKDWRKIRNFVLLKHGIKLLDFTELIIIWIQINRIISRGDPGITFLYYNNTNDLACCL